MATWIIMALTLAGALVGCAGSDADTLRLLDHEGALLRNLTTDYDTAIRPALGNETVTISFGLALINMMELDEKRNFLAARYWLRFLWKDVRLAWDPSAFGGIDSMRVPVDKLWQPDITLYNSAREDTDATPQNTLAVVYRDGSVLWIPPMVLKSTCSVDLNRFPFDTQTCHLKFGSWTYDGFKLNVEFYEGLEEIDMTDYIVSNEWSVQSSGAIKNVKYYPCCAEPYPDLTFSLTLKRMSPYFTKLYIVPAVLLSILVPFVFMLPVGHTHRYVLGVGVLLCLTVMLSGFDGLFAMSTHTGTPLLGQFYTSLQALICLSLVLSVIFTNLAAKGARGIHPPAIVGKLLIDVVGRLLCVSRDGTRLATEADGDKDDLKPHDHPASDWLTVARVLDRLCLVVFVVIMVIMLIAFTAH